MKVGTVRDFGTISGFHEYGPIMRGRGTVLEKVLVSAIRKKGSSRVGGGVRK